MRSETQRLRKGTGYPLKPSVLTAVLRELDPPIEWHLIRGGSGALLDCHFWPPNPNVPHERLYIRSAALPREQVHAAKVLLETSVMPDLLAWLKHILSQPQNSPVRREQQYFVRHLSSTEL